MSFRGSSHRRTRWAAILIMATLSAGGCESSTRQEAPAVTPQPAAARAQNLAATRLAQQEQKTDSPAAELQARPVGPRNAVSADAVTDIGTQIPDPRDIQAILERDRDEELALLDQRPLSPEARDRERQDITAHHARRLERILARTANIHRPNQAELSLTDAIRRTLQNSYALQVQAYNPAIDATRIVEAEAQFDAVYFANLNYSKQDYPTASQLVSSLTDTRSFETGVRKLLSTGMQVRASYAVSRNYTNLAYATINPSYFNSFIVEFRQPFLRGFGLDYNRSQIEMQKLNRMINVERLRREIRETIFNVEQTYWTLLQARRAVTVSARLLTELETILDWLTQRKEAGYDVYGVQLNLTISRIEQRKVDFIRRCNDVRNAEDALKTLMNDPDLNLAADVEIIPVDTASLEPVVLDELGEISAALTHRSELHEARHTIEQAQLAVGVAKNQAMPRLDAMFRYMIDGLGQHWYGAFSQMSENDFNEYVLAIEFEWPIGNRGPEAAVRRARLQQAQAIAAHRGQIESVIREVKQAIRDLHTNYEQLGPTLHASRATRDQLRATKARQERLDPPALQVELDAHEALASSRDTLLQVLANYNVALTNLERRKGTLLHYNNIAIRGLDNEKYQAPYRPAAP